MSDEEESEQGKGRLDGWRAHKAQQERDARKSDHDYWLSLTPEERSWAVWDLTVLAWEAKGIDITKLRSDRTRPWKKRRLGDTPPEG